MLKEKMKKDNDENINISENKDNIKENENERNKV